jgi:tungstate transport system substrate-binding protein
MKKLLTSALLGLTLFSAPLFAKDAPEAPKIIKMATTTSTENSGLLTDLLPKFEKESGYSIQVIASLSKLA